MRTEIVEETKNMEPGYVGETYIYHYIEYRFMRPPKEVRITRYNDGIMDGQTERIIVIHSHNRFSKHVEPRIPHQKQLIKIPFDKNDLLQLYRGQIVDYAVEASDPVLRNAGISKKTINDLIDLKIAEHCNNLKDYYSDLRKIREREKMNNVRRRNER